jgi:hypothetical protein
MTKISHRIAVAATGIAWAGALVVGSAGVSAAAPSDPGPSTTTRNPGALIDAKRAGAEAIADRQAQLTKLDGRLRAAPNCDTDGKVATKIATDAQALAALGTKLAGDTTLADARADYQSIFQDYRVYLVVTPQAYATSACGHIQTAAATLTEDQAKLAARVQAAADAGADMTGARTALQDMTTQLHEATTLADRANGALAAIGPDHGDKAVAASNQTAVESAHADLVKAGKDLGAALADARAVVADLKAAAGRH